MEITINTKQVVAAVWTMIAIVISLIVVLAMGLPSTIFASPPWWFMVAAFFGVFLVVTLPVFLLIALWAIATRPESE